MGLVQLTACSFLLHHCTCQHSWSIQHLETFDTAQAAAFACDIASPDLSRLQDFQVFTVPSDTWLFYTCNPSGRVFGPTWPVHVGAEVLK